MKSTAIPVVISILLLIIHGSHAAALGPEPVEVSFEEANTAYSSGDYRAAISRYEEITHEAGFSASVLFNLANAYARDGQIGKAIVSYERALLIASDDSDIIGNLQLVKKESGLFVRDYSRIEKLLFSLSLNQWLLLFLAGLASLAVFHLVTLFRPVSRKNTVIFSALWIIVLSLSGVGVYVGYQQFNPSIVISPGARLLISPFDSAASVGKVQEGRRVYPIKKHGAYTYVVDETDRRGWLTDSSIEAVCEPVRLKNKS